MKMCFTRLCTVYALITVEPNSVDTFVCPKCIVFDLCSHISFMAGSELSIIWRFHCIEDVK